MSFPTTSSAMPSQQSQQQQSIKSFFQPRQPRYAPPPSQPPRAPSPEPTPDAQLLAESASSAAEPSGSAPHPPPPAPPQQRFSTLTTDPPPSATASIPPEATIRPLVPSDIQPLKRINSLLLPVAYPDAFYAAALNSPFSRAITWADTSSAAATSPKLIGALVCRLESVPASPATSPPQQHALYIQSLALLSPYRSHGLVSAALADLLALAAQAKALNVSHAYAHVWTENDDALGWYAARGFEREPVPLAGYYLKLRPDSAFVVRRDLRPLPLVASSRGSDAAVATLPSVTAAAANLPPMDPPAMSADSLCPSSHQHPTPTSQRQPSAHVPPPPPPRTPSAQSQSSSSATSLPRGQSFQNKRAETEWNDLPADMMTTTTSASGTSTPGLLAPPGRGGSLSGPSSGNASESSSRSSSTVRKKKERKYAAAAFGS